MSKSQAGIYILLWLVLATSVVLQIHTQGSKLYYPVVVAWLGGIVSYILLRELRKWFNERK